MRTRQVAAAAAAPPKRSNQTNRENGSKIYQKISGTQKSYPTLASKIQHCTPVSIIDLITITRALDRVLLWNYYVIPQWHISAYRVLYWDMFDQPKIKPKYSLGFDTWWINQNKFDFINSQRSSN